jgi:[acyl-carrier-protein] S-malonyltransferase
MSLGLLFPGQGTQHPDMLPWLETEVAAAPVMLAMEQVLGDWRRRLTDSAWSTANSIAQPLLTGVSLAAWQVLAPRLPAPSAVLGYSVGELPAFCAAGVYDVPTALFIAQRRAASMDAAVAHQATGLLAIHGLHGDRLHRLGQEFGLTVAIEQDEEQLLIGGLQTELARARVELEAEGVRCTPVAIQVASHTPWMMPAVAPLLADLQALSFTSPQCPVVTNATGQSETRPETLKQALATQIAQTVRWHRCMDTLAERGVSCVLEVGPGTTLSRLWNRRHPQIPARSVEDFRSPDGVIRWVMSQAFRG